MENDFLEKIKPFLDDQEIIVQEFVVQALKEYPLVPSEWTNLLLENLLERPKMNRPILMWLDERKVDAESAPLIIQVLNKLPKNRKHLGKSFLFELSPEVIINYEKDLGPYITRRQIDFYHGLVNSTQEELNKQFNDKIEYLEKLDRYSQSDYREVKIIQNELLRRQWIDENELDTILKTELEKEWFTYKGVLAVRAIGLMKLPSYIPILAILLASDDDVLLEEVAEALIHYQSDQVVEAVKPYAMQQKTYIFALSVLENTKTEYAETALVECYDVLDEDGKGMVIEGLAHQLSEKAFPLIDDYLFQEYHYGMNDMDQILYSFYKIMGRTHPKSESWKASWEKRKQYFLENEPSVGVLKKTEPVAVTKVGRNDQCPCGSGKKYKKCCGKG